MPMATLLWTAMQVRYRIYWGVGSVGLAGWAGSMAEPIFFLLRIKIKT